MMVTPLCSSACGTEDSQTQQTFCACFPSCERAITLQLQNLQNGVGWWAQRQTACPVCRQLWVPVEPVDLPHRWSGPSVISKCPLCFNPSRKHTASSTCLFGKPRFSALVHSCLASSKVSLSAFHSQGVVTCNLYILNGKFQKEAFVRFLRSHAPCSKQQALSCSLALQYHPLRPCPCG